MSTSEINKDSQNKLNSIKSESLFYLKEAFEKKIYIHLFIGCILFILISISSSYSGAIWFITGLLCGFVISIIQTCISYIQKRKEICKSIEKAQKIRDNAIKNMEKEDLENEGKLIDVEFIDEKAN